MRTKNAVGSGVPQAGLCYPHTAEAVPRLGRQVRTGTVSAGESWWQQTRQGRPLGCFQHKEQKGMKSFPELLAPLPDPWVAPGLGTGALALPQWVMAVS